MTQKWSDSESQVEQVANLEVPFSVVLAEKRIPVEKVLELRPGVVLELSRRQDQPLEARVSGSRIGRGRAVGVGERLGFQLESVDPARKLEAGGNHS